MGPGAIPKLVKKNTANYQLALRNNEPTCDGEWIKRRNRKKNKKKERGIKGRNNEVKI